MEYDNSMHCYGHTWYNCTPKFQTTRQKSDKDSMEVGKLCSITRYGVQVLTIAVPVQCAEYSVQLYDRFALARTSWRPTIDWNCTRCMQCVGVRHSTADFLRNFDDALEQVTPHHRFRFSINKGSRVLVPGTTGTSSRVHTSRLHPNCDVAESKKTYIHNSYKCMPYILQYKCTRSTGVKGYGMFPHCHVREVWSPTVGGRTIYAETGSQIKMTMVLQSFVASLVRLLVLVTLVPFQTAEARPLVRNIRSSHGEC